MAYSTDSLNDSPAKKESFQAFIKSPEIWVWLSCSIITKSSFRSRTIMYLTLLVKVCLYLDYLWWMRFTTCLFSKKVFFKPYGGIAILEYKRRSVLSGPKEFSPVRPNICKE